MLIYTHRVRMIILWRFYCGSFVLDFFQPGPERKDVRRHVNVKLSVKAVW